MSNLVFLFDLDSTITRKEILPTIAHEVGKYDQMRELTERTMSGVIPFKQSFLSRVDLLRDMPVSRVNQIVEKIELNEKIVDFISRNRKRCFVVTGNLDVWISGLLDKLGMTNNVFCSKAYVVDDCINSVFSVLDKNLVAQQMTSPFVAIGDGNNDSGMIDAAEIGIGYGGVRNVASSVLECATHAVYDEEQLVYLLNKLL